MRCDGLIPLSPEEPARIIPHRKRLNKTYRTSAPFFESHRTWLIIATRGWLRLFVSVELFVEAVENQEAGGGFQEEKMRWFPC